MAASSCSAVPISSRRPEGTMMREGSSGAAWNAVISAVSRRSGRTNIRCSEK